MNDDAILDMVLLPREAAELLQIPERELLQRASAGELPGVCIGRAHWRFSRARLLKTVRRGSPSPASAVA